MFDLDRQPVYPEKSRRRLIAEHVAYTIGMAAVVLGISQLDNASFEPAPTPDQGGTVELPMPPAATVDGSADF